MKKNVNFIYYLLTRGITKVIKNLVGIQMINMTSMRA